jgi:hypothetical protein
MLESGVKPLVLMCWDPARPAVVLEPYERFAGDPDSHVQIA